MSACPPTPSAPRTASAGICANSSAIIIPINLRGEDALGERGYYRLADVPGPVQVVDCLNSQRVGAVVDQAIAEKDRLGIEAVWLQLGVIDEAAAERARGQRMSS